MTILEAARMYVSKGINVLPIYADGSKSPSLRAWEYLQQRMATDAELESFFTDGSGLAAVGGRISDNLEDLDCDSAELFDQFRSMAVDALGKEFWDRLWIVRTPRPGYAIIYRCPDGV